MVFSIQLPVDSNGKQAEPTSQLLCGKKRSRPVDPKLPDSVDIMTVEGTSRRIPIADFQRQVFRQAKIFNRHC